MPFFLKLSCLLIFSGICFLAEPTRGDPSSPPLRVVATLAPIHSLLSGLMKGRGAPELLIEGPVSPHTYFLRPKDLRLIAEADLIFWIGPPMETFLTKSLSVWPKKKVTLLEAPNLRLFPQRQNTNACSLEKPAGLVSGHPHLSSQKLTTFNSSLKDLNTIDPHIWLMPENALVLVHFMADRLSEKDPAGHKIYQKNAERLSQKFHRLRQTLKHELQDLKKHPFLVLHDGYQYFEKSFELTYLGSIMIHPEVDPSPRHMACLLMILKKNPGVCLFGEAQFPQKWIDFLRKKGHINVGILDPISVQSSPENEPEEGYFTLMRTLGKNFQACFKKNLPLSPK